MKLALNGALTIASHDGANNEICAAVGHDNIWMFGNAFEELENVRRSGYDPAAVYESHAEIRQSLDMIRAGYFSPDQRDVFAPIFDALVRGGDRYMVLADYDDYARAQTEIDAAYADTAQWMRKAVLNIARIGSFSIDRLTREYATQVWHSEPVRSGG
jgi:starch phosphorylase